HVHHEDFADPLGLERHAARQHLVEDHPDRVEVRSRIDSARARALLGAHVKRRPKQHTCLRAMTSASTLYLCDPEIENLDVLWIVAPGPQEDVLGLEVPMHDAGSMGGREPSHDLARDSKGPIFG